jgi:hypothetical protein
MLCFWYGCADSVMLTNDVRLSGSRACLDVAHLQSAHMQQPTPEALCDVGTQSARAVAAFMASCRARRLMRCCPMHG